MLRKTRSARLGVVTGILMLFAALACAYFWRPIKVQIANETLDTGYQARAPLWTVGEALYAAGIGLDAADRVTPALADPLPLDGKITVDRAVIVTLWENGKTTRLTSFESNLSAALAEAGITLRPEDRILQNGSAVSPETALSNQKSYVFQIERARPFRVVANGEEITAYTQAQTVAHALWEANHALSPGDQLSLDPAQTLDEVTPPVTLLRALPLTIHVDGQILPARSAAATVGEALAQHGITLQGLDRAFPAEDQPLPADGQIRVARVMERLEFEQTLTPYDFKTMPDPETELDQRRVMVAGQYGVQISRYRTRYEDGEEVSRVLDSDYTATEAKDQIVGIGAKAVPQTVETPDGTIEYYRAVTVYATGYSPCNNGTDHCAETTASGAKLTKGMIAVIRSWYNAFAGQRVYIPGYGFAIIADVGGGIPGRHWIDLGYDDSNFVGGARSVTLYFLTPVPPNVPLVLP